MKVHTDKPYDLSYLKSLSEDPSFLEKMIRLYLKTTPGLVASLRLAIENQDLEESARALHQLKSAAAAIGMTQLKTAIEAAETMVKKDEKWSIDKNQLETLAASFDRCMELLSKELD